MGFTAKAVVPRWRDVGRLDEKATRNVGGRIRAVVRREEGEPGDGSVDFALNTEVNDGAGAKTAGLA